MYRHNALSSKDTVKSGDGAGVAVLPEFDPENGQAGMRIPAAHIADQLELLLGMLVGMGMWASGTVTEGIPGAVIAAFPPVNILAVGLVFNGSLGNAKFFSMLT